MEVRVLSWAPNSKGRCKRNGLFLFPPENLAPPAAAMRTDQPHCAAASPGLEQVRASSLRRTRLIMNNLPLTGRAPAAPPWMQSSGAADRLPRCLRGGAPSPLRMQQPGSGGKRLRQAGTSMARACPGALNPRKNKNFAFFLLDPKTPPIIHLFLRAQMAELVDALVSGTSE